MKERKCLYCGNSFPLKHRNRQYCSHECYMENKKERTRERYAHMKLYEPIKKNDEILAKVYSEGLDVVSIERLESLGFTRIYISRQSMKGNKHVNITGRFGYMSYSPTEVLILKIEQ